MADISITVANVLASSSAQTVTATAGATITAGQALYIDTANSNVMKLSDSNATAPANTVAGIALHASLSGQPITYVTQDPSFTLGGTLTVGSGSVYLSNTAGGITQTIGDLASGSTVIDLGPPVTTTTINFRPLVGGTK